MEHWLASVFIGVVFSVIGWLLSNKDKKQGEEIKELKSDLSKSESNTKSNTDILFKLHHQLEKELSDYKLKIAENHYPKNEMDQRFAELGRTLKDGFAALGIELKEMNKSLNEHFKDHHKGGGQ